MSIFNTLPPLFHSTDIEKIAFDHFGMNVKVVKLNSERDQNFYLSDISGQEYVMKIFNEAEELQIVDMQNQVLYHVTFPSNAIHLQNFSSLNKVILQRYIYRSKQKIII